MTTPTPSVPNFLAGFGPQQSDMQSLWANSLAFMQQRTIFRATQTTTATTLPSSGATTTIAFDNIIEDPYSGWDATHHRWLAPFSAWYHVTLTVFVSAPGATQVVLQPLIQGTGGASNLAQNTVLGATVLPSAASGAAECTWYPFLVAGVDYVFGAAQIQNSGSNVNTNLSAGAQSSMEIVWIVSLQAGGMDISLLQQLIGPVGATVAAVFFGYLFVTGKIHSDKEFRRLLRENDELKRALEDERRVANEAVRTGSVTNRLIGALVEVSSERQGGKRPLALPQPGAGPYPETTSDARDAEM